MKRDFLIWFKEQYGKRPCATKINILESQYDIAKITAESKLDLLIRTREWDASREGGLYAWNVGKFGPKK